MQKIIMVWIVIGVLISHSDANVLNVVTTTQDLAALAQEVGRDLIQVKSLTKGSQDAHFIEPKPSMILAAKKADMLVCVGASLEIGWLPVLLQSARNKSILVGQPGYVDGSTVVELLDKPAGPIDRSMGDVHPEGNPHYLLDPMNGLAVAKLICERLATLDPANASAYQRNYADFETRLMQANAVWHEKMALYKGQPVLEYHSSWRYLLNAFGLAPAGQLEEKPGIAPSPARLKAVIDLIEQQQVNILLFTTYQNEKHAKYLNQKTGIHALKLPLSVGGIAGVDTYIGLFDYLVNAISAALQED
ncbi:MAG: zinc ABC transporter substrate-binding protein [Gemmatimonadetes bacterium]|nr:MAG: zinc ABC transporter substrate-binding protein [Gemmatimonadota bacterium]